MFRKDVSPLSDILSRCLRDNGLEMPLMQKRLLESWNKVAGPVVSKYTGDKFIKNQTLFVKVLNPALRADLTMMRGRLVKNLNVEVGCNVITDIKFF